MEGISGFKSHPERDRLFEYSFEGIPTCCPWIGRLDFMAWGKSTNLFCYFTDEATGGKYVLSTFASNQYKPYLDGPGFKHEALGGRYEIKTSLSKNGMTKFDSARRLDMPHPARTPEQQRQVEKAITRAAATDAIALCYD
jgi:hypothetical protein